MSKKAVAIFSGGLDSTTLVWHMLSEGYDTHLLSFDYGQRHKKEIQYAKMTAKSLGLKHDIIDISGLTHLISNSALTGQAQFDTTGGLVSGDPDCQVPDGHYAEETMKATVVPNRNMIMLAIAGGVAVNERAEVLGIGVHSGDHFIYPDCRERFIYAANAAIVIGNENFGSIPSQPPHANPTEFIYAPFMDWTKTDIAYRALELGVPLHTTWSCYKGGLNHCGRCGTCVERLEAIDEAEHRARVNKIIPDGIHGADQTVYEDDEYWKVATNASSR